MAFHNRKQHNFSRQIIRNNRQQYEINQVAATSFNSPVQIGSEINQVAATSFNSPVQIGSEINQVAATSFNSPVQMGSEINQVAATSFNSPVQMGSENPSENPWIGMNQPQPNALISSQSSGRANMLPNGQRKHFGSVSTESLSKRLKMQFPKNQNQAVQPETPILNILKESDAEILSLGNSNMPFQEDVKNFSVDNQKRREYATGWESKTMSAHNSLELARAMVRMLHRFLPLHNSAEEHDVKSYNDCNVSEKNAPSNAQVVAVEDIGGTSGEVQTGEGSGVKRMCMSCREMEMSFLALPCWHLCFCIVCGTRQSILQDPCPVCETTITATAPVSLVSDE